MAEFIWVTIICCQVFGLLATGPMAVRQAQEEARMEEQRAAEAREKLILDPEPISVRISSDTAK